MYNNSTNSFVLNILPFTPHTDIEEIIDCALVYNSENAIPFISLLSNLSLLTSLA